MNKLSLATFFFALIFFWQAHAKIITGTRENIKKLPAELQEQALEILEKYENYEKNKTSDSSLKIDLDNGMKTSIYSKSGIFNTEQCSEDKKCKALGWPDNQSTIRPTGKLEFHFNEDEEGDQILSTYVQVDFSYERQGSRKGTGWMAQDYISFKPVTPSFSEIVVEKIDRAQEWIKEKFKQICDPVKKEEQPLPQTKIQNQNLTDLAKVAEFTEEKTKTINKERKTVSEIADALSSSVGLCVLQPPNKAPQKFSGSIAYDEFALNEIKKIPLPEGIKKEDGTDMTRQELGDIDALARTIFAEMASCTPIGAQYPMAVARVIKNREIAMKANSNFMDEFIKKNKQHDAEKSLLSKAATSPILFSAWNQDVIDFKALKKARAERAKALLKKMSSAKALKIAKEEIRPDPDTKEFYKKNDSGLLHSLCPPSDPKGLCYTGGKPDENLNAVWQNTLKIATETVLYPEQFLAKTDELKGIKHYTSNRAKFYDFKEVKPSIEGRQISSKRCLNLWRPLTPEEKAAKKKK